MGHYSFTEKQTKNKLEKIAEYLHSYNPRNEVSQAHIWSLTRWISDSRGSWTVCTYFQCPGVGARSPQNVVNNMWSGYPHLEEELGMGS